ncbi:nuclear movement domain-containing [Cystoisospora suis]|uniref:Nuclear movement domain-containing n=1 Tax=Cystoisospora suis TaxID=483139 RepID=A0A2C6KFS0_9APIC|nr:nuclear movement domain-containing [Cystoisospora suis]
MVDYSKWDHLEVSSDEDSSRIRQPRVRRLEDKQKVTIGPSGLSIGDDEPPGSAAPSGEPPKVEEISDEEDNVDEFDEDMACACEGNSQADDDYEDAHEWPRCGFLPPAPPQVRKRPQLSGEDRHQPNSQEGNALSSSQTKRRDDEILLIQNGGVVQGRYLWSQTKHEVNIDIRLPPEARGKDVKVAIKENSCTCTYKGQVVLKGDFCHKVEDDEDMWLWELVERKINWKRLAHLAEAYNYQSSEKREKRGRSEKGQKDRKEESLERLDDEGGSGISDRLASAKVPDNPSGQIEANMVVEAQGKKKNEDSSYTLLDITMMKTDEKKEPGMTGSGEQKTDEEKEEKEKEEEKTMFLEINLRKKPEVANTFVWWNCIVKGDPCIDVENLPGRVGREQTTKNFKEAWEQAHKMFLEKIKSEVEELIEV